GPRSGHPTRPRYASFLLSRHGSTVLRACVAGNSRALNEFPTAGTLSRMQPLHCQPEPRQRFASRRQARAAIGVRGHLYRFCLRRVGMDDLCQGAQAYSRGDGERESIDHFACMLGDNCSAQDSIRAVSYMYFYESLVFPIGDRPIDVLHENCESLDGYGPCAGLANVETDMGYFGIGVVHQGIVSALSLLRPTNSAFCTTMRAEASAVCVNLCVKHTSPAA